MEWNGMDLLNTVRKLSFSITIYQKWKEWNRRIFEDQTKEEGHMVTQIQDMVRHAIMGKDRSYERSFANWLCCKNWGSK